MVMLRLLYMLSLLTLLTLPAIASAQKTLSAGVDRTLVEQGDIIQLTVTANFQTVTAGPDFSQLEPDFEVLGVTASSQLRVINGQFTATTQWDAQIIAKRLGILTLPVFDVEGAQSKTLSIEVSAPSQPQADYQISFLEAQVDQAEPYLQSQVIFTLRYYHLGSLIRGSINPPQFDQALSERLRNQHSFERRVNGRIYRVYEWVYALYPQRSGEWVIPAQTFEGQLLHNRQIRLVNEQTQPIHLKVKPIPASYPVDAVWLPAKSLQLDEQWGAISDNLRVGDTLNRQIRLQVNGLRVSQLPDPVWPQETGLRLYADPIQQNEHLLEQSIQSIKIQDTVAVIQQEGELTSRAITVPWWNTTTDQLEMAQLPARRFTALPNVTSFQSVEADGFIQPNAPPTLWMGLTALFAILWLLTLGLLLRQRYLTSASPGLVNATGDVSPSFAPTNTVFQYDGAALYHRIQRWLAEHYDIQDWRRLHSSHPRLYALMQDFERQLFAAETTSLTKPSVDKDQLQHELNAFRPAPSSKTQPSDTLKPLYPDR